MSNVLETIGHDLKVGAEDVVKGVGDVFEVLPKVVKVLETAIEDQNTLKAAIEGLVGESEKVIAAVASAVTADGTNIADDAAVIAAVEAFAAWFKASFVPVIESVYTDIKADVS